MVMEEESASSRISSISEETVAEEEDTPLPPPMDTTKTSYNLDCGDTASIGSQGGDQYKVSLTSRVWQKFEFNVETGGRGCQCVEDSCSVDMQRKSQNSDVVPLVTTDDKLVKRKSALIGNFIILRSGQFPVGTRNVGCRSLNFKSI